MSTKISTLIDFIEWTEKFNDGQYLFRGVSKVSYNIEASAYRCLPEEDKYDVDKLLKINREMLDKARLLGHDLKDGRQLFDLELLAELQHYGAATCLIDFTRNPLFALWFACQRGSSGPQEDGKVVVLRSEDLDSFRTVDYELSEKALSCFFEPELHNDRYPLYQWEPKHQNNRIIAQQLVFVFGGAEVELAEECVVVESCKKNILNSLEKSFGVTEASMFPDFYGFAHLHSQHKRYVETDAQGLRHGIEAHLVDNLDEVIDYYTLVVSLDPNIFIAADAYRLRGVAYDMKEDFEAAIEDFSKAIDLNPADAATYHLRGVAYRRKGDFEAVIEDYSTAIDLNPADADAYYNLGLAWLPLREWENARADLTIAKNMGVDIVDSFHNAYGSVADFEARYDVQVPEDIAALLNPHTVDTKPLVLTEGKTDARYIRTALELLGEEELLNSLEIRPVGGEGTKGDEGGGQPGLNKCRKAYVANPQSFKHGRLLLYDWDANKSPYQIEKLWVRSIPKNSEDVEEKKGIENLFPSHLFRERFYEKKTKKGIHGKFTVYHDFKKQDFCEWICEERRDFTDFEKFKDVVQILKEFVNYLELNNLM